MLEKPYDFCHERALEKQKQNSGFNFTGVLTCIQQRLL